TGLLEVISEWIDEGHFTNPKTHEEVSIHPDFRLFATLNPIQGVTRLSLGRNTLPAPFINRFKLAWVNEKTSEEQFIILKELLERAGIKTTGNINNISGALKSDDATSFTSTGLIHAFTDGTYPPQTPAPAPRVNAPVILPGHQGQQFIKALARTGEQDSLPRIQMPQIKATGKDETEKPKRELSNEELNRLIEDIEKDPIKRQALLDKINAYQSFFERVTEGRVKIRPGKYWAYSPKEETLIYPVSDILDTELDKLVGLGIHEGMHRYGTRYIDFMPFLDELTNLLFNAAEDVAIENWAGYLVQGADKYIQKIRKNMDQQEWQKNCFGEGIPEHIKFVFGILYYGKRGQLPDMLKGDARDALETDKVKDALNRVFNALPMIRDEQGVLRVNKEPTPMEILAAAKLRVEIMRDEILPIYKRLLAQRAEQLSDGGFKLQPGEGKEKGEGEEKEKGEGKEIDLDSLPEDIRKELEKEIRKYSEELKDKTKEGSKSWQDTQKEKENKEKLGQKQKEQERADELTRQRQDREKEGRRLSDAEKFARMKALEDRVKSSFNRYQLNLDIVKRLVHALTGQMANIIREDTKPRWQSGLRKGKDIDWDRFFISLLSGYSDDRYWRDRIVPTKRGIKFTLVIDESVSMSGARGENALLASIVFMDVLQNLGIDFNVRGFGSNTYLHKGFRNQLEANVRRSYDTIKERNELIEELSSSMATGYATADGDALNAAVEDIRNHAAEKNIILVLTDGDGNKGMPIRDALDNAQSLGIKVIGIGIGEGVEYVSKNYEHHVQIPSIEMLPAEFKRILRKEIESMSMAPAGKPAKSSSAGTAVSIVDSVKREADVLSAIGQAS
ncbi:MAG: VWA domain-containing protein, partial [Candidatus Omnitrophica bacterium]|nr:VWA domain-containing protein [Candidatus Omnitrophota bacterium]